MISNNRVDVDYVFKIDNSCCPKQLLEGIVCCLTYPLYRCLYLVAYSDQVEDVYRICKSLSNHNGIYLRHSMGRFSLMFPNNSIFECEVVNPATRGKRCNSVYYDDMIDKSIVEQVIRPIVRNYSDMIKNNTFIKFQC